jgi:hypothetical protein
MSSARHARASTWASIEKKHFNRRRWIAGSSPAMTKDGVRGDGYVLLDARLGTDANENCSNLNKYLPAFDDRGISLDRNHARRPDNRAGPDIELPAVKIAFDDVAFDEAFRQRARAVRAVIVGHEEFAAKIEDGERQIVLLDLEHGSRFYVGSVA